MYLPLLSLLHECLTTPLLSDQEFPHNSKDPRILEKLENQDALPEIIAELARLERVHSHFLTDKTKSAIGFMTYFGLFCSNFKELYNKCTT